MAWFIYIWVLCNGFIFYIVYTAMYQKKEFQFSRNQLEFTVIVVLFLIKIEKKKEKKFKEEEDKKEQRTIIWQINVYTRFKEGSIPGCLLVAGTGLAVTKAFLRIRDFFALFVSPQNLQERI